MPAISSQAPAKAILVGEHAVVYHQPAIAFPINQRTSKTGIFANPLGSPDEIRFIAKDINFDDYAQNLYPTHPFCAALDAVKQLAGVDHLPACTVKIKSSIPIASGLGSSASISVCLIKALCQFIGYPASPQQIIAAANKVEIQYHGTPSGIDSTVITENQMIYFVKGEGFHPISIANPFQIIIANSGIPGNTKEAVAAVRQSWVENTFLYNDYFQEIGKIVQQSEIALKSGDFDKLGQLMFSNHILLQKLGVSMPTLDILVDAAMQAGAYGAKISGGGLGGNIIALVAENKVDIVSATLLDNGAQELIKETVLAGSHG